MNEQTLVFIKPDGVKRHLVGEIIARFEKRGLILKALQHMQMTEDFCQAHYHEHMNKPFYPRLKEYMLSGPVVAFVLEAENVVGIVRQMVGITNAAEAASGTIRGDFAHSLAHNVIHASDSRSSAKSEIARFFPNLSA